eukprot:CAMPEP_0170817514 /NCGR_PEP_ID=MMETSP0733-20121128/40069_1 /TAXON_ID=186038 /ORGANISM="Fragilariopsis kerguelensis, Strain L26-C5" /LENGTH=732 /DNA_ID=CAMNT_0011177217 /DNA_START=67 /DNA_END=2265 /DNA_ORIENTATION=+
MTMNAFRSSSIRARSRSRSYTNNLQLLSLLSVLLVSIVTAQIHPRNNHQPRQKLGDQPKCGEPGALPSLYGLICDNNMGLFEPADYGNNSFDQSFDIFCDAIQETDLDDLFESSGRMSFFGKPHDIDDSEDILTETSFTVFAPTNQAFSNLPKATGDDTILEYLLSEDGHATLNTIIVNHFVVANIITPNEIQCNSDTDTGILDDGKSSTTICGSIFGPIYQVGPGNTKEAYRPTYSSGSNQSPSHNVSPVAPVYACNGIMYIMDNVILPTLPVRVVSSASTATATPTTLTPTAPPSSSFLRGTNPVIIEEAAVQEDEPVTDAETDTEPAKNKKPTKNVVKDDETTAVEEESSSSTKAKTETETAVKEKEESTSKTEQEKEDNNETTVETETTNNVGTSIKKKEKGETVKEKESSTSTNEIVEEQDTDSTNNMEEDPSANNNNPIYEVKTRRKKLTCQEIKNQGLCKKKLKNDKPKNRKAKDVCPKLCNKKESTNKKKKKEQEETTSSVTEEEQETTPTVVDDTASSSVSKEEESTTQQKKKDPSTKNPPTYHLIGEETQLTCYEIKNKELCHTKLQNDEERTANNVCPKLCSNLKKSEEESTTTTIQEQQETTTVGTTAVEKKEATTTQEEKVVATTVNTTTPAKNKKLNFDDTTTPVAVATSNQQDLVLPPDEKVPVKKNADNNNTASVVKNENKNTTAAAAKNQGTNKKEDTDNKEKQEEEETEETNDE